MLESRSVYESLFSVFHSSKRLIVAITASLLYVIGGKHIIIHSNSNNQLKILIALLTIRNKCTLIASKILSWEFLSVLGKFHLFDKTKNCSFQIHFQNHQNSKLNTPRNFSPNQIGNTRVQSLTHRETKQILSRFHSKRLEIVNYLGKLKSKYHDPGVGVSILTR